MLGELVQALAPTAAVSIAGTHGLERRLAQRELGLLAERLEGGGHHRLMAALALLLPGMGEGYLPIGHHFPVHAAQPEFRSIGRTHAGTPSAAGAHLALAMGHREAPGRQ